MIDLTDMSFTRRDVLGMMATAVAMGTGALAAADPVDTIIDTHTHFFDPTRKDGPPWPGKGDKLLYRAVLPEEFQALTKPYQVAGTVVVEASPRVEDNQWILDLAERNPFVVGLVGNLPVGTPEFAGHLTRFAKNPRFRGLRVNHAALKAGLENKDYVADVRRLAEHDLELDINGGPDMLTEVARVAKLIPELRIVINHVANVRIDGKTPPAEWTEGMQTCAAFEKVFCKVSALVEGARKESGISTDDVQFYVPVLDVVWKAFGEDRLVYGSNWPVSVRYAPYPQVQQIAADYFRGKGRTAYEKFFWKNSVAAYKWPAQKKG